MKKPTTKPNLLQKLRKNLWVLIPVVFVLGAAVAAFTILDRDTAGASGKPVVCKDSTAAEFSCWQSRYNTMVAGEGPKAAFVDFKANFDTNPYVKSNCHQIGHVIGRAAAKRYVSLAETYKYGDQFCWSGYYHGAVETVADRIGPDKIISQLNDICSDFLDSKPYSFDHYNCVHGMGHGLMAIQDDELFTSLKTCDGYKDSWQASSCYSGVFMENVMNEINPGKKSSYLKQDDPLYPCTAVESKYMEQCYMMQTSHALTVVSYDYDKVFEVCSKVQSPYDTTCFQSLGRDVSGQSGSEQSRTIELCMKGPSAAAKENCFIGAVKDFISYFHDDKQGLAMCDAITDATLSASCTATGKNYYTTF